MAKQFSLKSNMLNEISKNTKLSTELEARDNFKVEFIDVNDLFANKKNFYEIVDIEELEEDIFINGLNHNLVVRKKGDKYEIISGERRYRAIRNLVENGQTKFKKIPCKVINLNDVDTEIVLIQANAQTRILSDSDRLKQIERLTKLYTQKKKKGEKIGKIKEIISKDTGLSESQIGRYSAINKGLIPEL